jgi:hypothetical protein
MRRLTGIVIAFALVAAACVTHREVAPSLRT